MNLPPGHRGLRRLCGVLLGQHHGGQPDGQLLERFLLSGDESAFEQIVRRHGSMVFGVCQRVLGNRHDAEDAFQATFLVLVQRASAICPRDQVGNWLYGVAYRVALKARTNRTLRRVKEVRVENCPDQETSAPAEDVDLRPLLDRALFGLPTKYRLPILLCDLECKPRKEVADYLGIPEGTLSSRLHKGRQLLGGKLRRLGLPIPAAGLAVLMTREGALAKVSAALSHQTVQSASHVLGLGAGAGVIPSPTILSLTNGALRAMWWSKFKTIMLCSFLLLGALGLLGGVILHKVQAQNPSAQEQTKTRAEKTPIPRNIQTPRKVDVHPSLEENDLARWSYRKTWEKTTGLISILDMEFDISPLQGAPVKMPEVIDYVVESLKKKGIDLSIVIEEERAPSFTDATVKLPAQLKTMTVGEALRLTLTQIPATAEDDKSTFMIREGKIILTTRVGASLQTTMKTRFTANFDGTPLQLVLKELSGRTGASINLDPRVMEKANTPIRATFLNDTSLNSALEIITQMADLHVETLEEGVFVTSGPKGK